jgi:hypothetical protein
MDLLRQVQDLSAFTVSWDGCHQQQDRDLLVSEPIPTKRIGTLPPIKNLENRHYRKHTKCAACHYWSRALVCRCGWEK